LTKNQFYISQNALKLTCNNVKCQNNFPEITPQYPASRAGKGAERERGREGRKGEKGREETEKRGGRGRRIRIPNPLFLAQKLHCFTYRLRLLNVI